MKTLFQLLLLLVSFSSNAQFVYVPPKINIVPANPTTEDEVKVVRQYVTGNSSSLIDSSKWQSGHTIIVNNCYFEGSLTSPDVHNDTCNLGKLAPGKYRLIHSNNQSYSSDHCDFAYTNTEDTSFFVEKVLKNSEINSNHVIAYPNPFNDVIYVELSEVENAHFIITDCRGITLFSNPAVDVLRPNLPDGVYFLHILVDGEVRQTLKILRCSN